MNRGSLRVVWPVKPDRRRPRPDSRSRSRRRRSCCPPTSCSGTTRESSTRRPQPSRSRDASGRQQASCAVEAEAGPPRVLPDQLRRRQILVSVGGARDRIRGWRGLTDDCKRLQLELIAGSAVPEPADPSRPTDGSRPPVATGCHRAPRRSSACGAVRSDTRRRPAAGRVDGRPELRDDDGRTGGRDRPEPPDVRASGAGRRRDSPSGTRWVFTRPSPGGSPPASAGPYEYALPGWAGAGRCVARAPAGANQRPPRRPVVAMLDTGVADHDWFSRPT